MTARKGKGNVPKFSSAVDQNDAAGFTLPDSLPCSEIDFPVLIRRRPRANWKDVVDESDKWQKQLEEYKESKVVATPKPPFLKTETDYIKTEVFVHLIPALVETLNKARIWDAFTRDKCFFNGIDHIVQVLWNNNPRFPGRKERELHIFNMPWVREALMVNPRPYYPKSWLWPEEYAATLIQKTVRQYFIQRQEEVQEMRDFWRVLFLCRAGCSHRGYAAMRHTDKFIRFVAETIEEASEKLEVERENPEVMDFNPFLAKAFASASHLHKK